MSTLTSLVKSGKRVIVKTRTGFRSASRTALGLPDKGVSSDPLRPQADTPVADATTALGRSDKGVSSDPLRPQGDVLHPGEMTTLGQPDRKVAHDPMEPQDDTRSSL